MSRQSKTGLIIFIVGALIFGANIGAYYALNNEWGGPNFLGGCIQILSVTTVITGIVLMLAGANKGKPAA